MPTSGTEPVRAKESDVFTSMPRDFGGFIEVFTGGGALGQFLGLAPGEIGGLLLLIIREDAVVHFGERSLVRALDVFHGENRQSHVSM